MKVFGYKIVKESEYNRLKKSDDRIYQMYSYIYWFSGWPNVFDLLKKFYNGEINHCNVSSVRSDFAKTMGTDEWGRTDHERR